MVNIEGYYLDWCSVSFGPYLLGPVTAGSRIVGAGFHVATAAAGSRAM